MNIEGLTNLIFLGNQVQKLLTFIFSDWIETETVYETNCPVVQATSSLIQDTIVFYSQIYRLSQKDSNSHMFNFNFHSQK